MRRALPILFAAGFCWAGLCARSQGQLVLNAKLVHPRVIQYEPIRVEVRVDNNSAQEIQVGADESGMRLLFEIEQVPGQLIPTRADARMPTLTVPARKAATAEVNLAEIYDMRSTGPYTVRPKLEWGAKSYPGPKLYVDVIPGFEIGRLMEDVGGGRGVRTFSLLTLSRDRGEYLFLKIEEEDQGLCYGVIDLGRIVRLHEPTLSFDQQAQVHVLHQSGPTQFAHTILTAYGDVVERQTFRTSGGKPSLERDREGGVVIRGGEPAPDESPVSPGIPADNQRVPARENDLYAPVRSAR